MPVRLIAQVDLSGGSVDPQVESRPRLIPRQVSQRADENNRSLGLICDGGEDRQGFVDPALGRRRLDPDAKELRFADADVQRLR
ncbi:MAG: hypothetical protein FLDDKLPJ_03278 [Phycisphaerae bacterium]|nr:hypothetical protein [Phycisphaerae bacterium]